MPSIGSKLWVLGFGTLVIACQDDFMAKKLPDERVGSVQSLTTDELGGVTQTLSASSTTTQVMRVPAGSSIAGSSIALPPGALAGNVSLTISPGEELVSDATLQQLGITETVSAAGPSVAFLPSSDVEAVQPFTLALPISSGLGLALVAELDYAVMFKSIGVANGATSYYAGIIPRSELTVSGSTVTFQTKQFGVFQVIKAPVAVTVQAVKVQSFDPVVAKASNTNPLVGEWRSSCRERESGPHDGGQQPPSDGTMGGSPSGTMGGSPSGTMGGSPSGTMGGSPSGTMGGSPTGTMGGSPTGTMTPTGTPSGTMGGTMGGTPSGTSSGPYGSEGGDDGERHHDWPGYVDESIETFYRIDGVKFSGTTFAYFEEYFTTKDCSGSYYVRMLVNGEYTLHAARSNGALPVDIHVKAVAQAIGDRKSLAYANDNKLCGYADWQSGVAKSIGESECGRSEDGHNEVGRTMYDLFKVEGGKLYFGESEGDEGSGKTEAERPTEINVEDYMNKVQ